MARMFGTDGVRGVAGTELTIELAMKLGQEQMLFLWELPRHLQLHILQGNIK